MRNREKNEGVWGRWSVSVIALAVVEELLFWGNG